MTVTIISLILLLALSSFFSMAETAFFSLTFLELSEMKLQNSLLVGQVDYLIRNKQLLLSALLIGNNIANIGASFLVAIMTEELFGRSFLALSSAALTLLILVFCEISPKQLAINFNKPICLLLALPVRLSYTLLYPPAYLLSKIPLFLNLFFVSKKGKSITGEALRDLVNIGGDEGVIGGEERYFLQNMLQFHTVQVREIMTHRKDIFSLPANLRIAEALELIKDCSFSRIPLYKGDKENICGFISRDRLLKSKYQADIKLGELSNNLQFVPESFAIEELFSLFKQQQRNISIVIDEYGGVAGLVTRGDIVEAILGQSNSKDEAVGEEPFTRQAENGWLILGGGSITQFQSMVGIKIERKRHQRISTVNGYLINLNGSIPKEGTIIDCQEGQYKILSVTNNMIERIYFRKVDA